MNKRLLIAIFLFILCALPLTAFADEGVNAALVVGKENITVGDVVPVQVTVTHPQGWRVVFPALQETWGDLEVRSQGAPQITQNTDGTETTTQVIQVAHFRPGTVTTPEIALDIVNGEGTVQTVNVQPATLQVNSVLQENDTTLRDIKPQAELWQLSSSPIPFVASLGLALSIVGGAAFVAWKHRPIPDKRTPRERAIDELEAIDASNYIADGDLKMYSVRVSAALREYLQKGCGIPAHDLTTGELAQLMKQNQVPAETAAQIIQVLRVCDAAKFANDCSDVEAITTLTNVTQQIIHAYPPAPASEANKHEVKK